MMLFCSRAAGTYSNPTSVEPLTSSGIKLVICDMAGTTVEEHGAVYRVLRETMNKHGLRGSTKSGPITEDDMHEWHGAAKGEVIRHFLNHSFERSSFVESRPDIAVKDIDDSFEGNIKETYAEPGAVDFICPTLPDWLGKCRSSGIKVALNTGYPSDIQQALLTGLGLDALIDHYISAYETPAGRPAPFMIHRLMEMANICDVRQVAKVGDTVNDILEGRNAGCGLVVGVLSGADSAQALWDAGADIVVQDVTELPVIASPVHQELEAMMMRHAAELEALRQSLDHVKTDANLKRAKADDPISVRVAKSHMHIRELRSGKTSIPISARVADSHTHIQQLRSQLQ